MGRREWVGLGIVALELALAAGCGVDSYLTCGAPCEDSGSTNDATIPDTGTDSTTADAGNSKDASSDVTQQKDSNTGDGNCTGAFCSNGGNGCCNAAPVCNAGNRCATSCGAIDASCTLQGGDTCCQLSFCNNGHCSQCYAKDAGCIDDFQCCSNSCSGITNTCQ
jgi:hypothetical protein